MGIFEPFRAIGYITTHVPFSVQRLGTETFVTVSVGKAFQIYNVCNIFLFLFFFTVCFEFYFSTKNLMFIFLLLAVCEAQFSTRR